MEPAEALFESLSRWQRIRDLIDAGEAEGLYLECKAPHTPRLTRDQRIKLAEAVSGFSNTGGGVVIWGVSTTRHDHSGLDVLTQIEPLGSVRSFAQQVDATIPTLAYPGVAVPPSRVLYRRSSDTR